MDHDHVVNIDLEKQDPDRNSQGSSPSTTPSHTFGIQRTHEPVYTAYTKSCIVCRKTLLLSYFNCCAVCLGVEECGQGKKRRADPPPESLPITETPPSTPSTSTPTSPSSSITDPENNLLNTNTPTITLHCDSTYCRYTHLRPLMLLFALSELVPLLGGLFLLNTAIYRHD
ncbi:uncharacterized protein F4822DRAFT_29150 [Hypoxylon trugodes]|uniref:uncharacterized protein n=1 Tax=Hypoxylon trugodes TaxID=326681 RepID=UPI00218D58F2|nr:uncharacterized protein F4822DRAFT_29150 [Hypoxylon trugodes]KAI1393890.1 hypothetical protein F4822DRAFT_29150 [Hypoxylon trugodes]